VTVIVALLAAAFAAAVNVRMVLRVEDAGLNDAVTPDGSPLIENATVPLNPLCGVRLMVLGALVPAVRVTLTGAAASVKA